MTEHDLWVAIKKPAAERIPRDKALAAAVLILSTRGDVYLPNAEGEDVPCSSLTMEGIYDALVRAHDALLLPPL